MWIPETNNKISPIRLPQWRDNRKKYNIKGNIRTLQLKNCEVEKIIRSLREIGMFEEI